MSQQEEKQSVMVKRKKKWPFVLGAVAVAAAAAVFAAGSPGNGNMVIISPTETALLVRTDLQDSVSATGTVESANSMTVYSTMAYTVQEVAVKVGDKVQQGDLLCKLDGQSIQDQIDTQQAGLESSTAAGNASIAAAKDNYEQFKYNLENGLNPSVINAENAVTNAYNSYVSAQNTYDRYLAGMQAGENSAILAQENALRSARTAVDNAKDALENAKTAQNKAWDALDDLDDVWDDALEVYNDAEEALDDHNSQLKVLNRQKKSLSDRQKELEGQLAAAAEEDKPAIQAELVQVQTDLAAVSAQIAQGEALGVQLETAFNAANSACRQAEAAYEQGESACDTAATQVTACEKNILTCEEAYETALKQYQAALTSADNTLADYAKNVENNFAAYEKAKTSLEAAKAAARDQLQAYQNNLNTAYANAGRQSTELVLEQLQADLDATRITAPMTGTVTAVYAKVGSAGSGLLFVIEDTDHFVISTSLKDYDIALVEEGTPAAIRSDATGDDVYEGTITYIAPTANKNAMGDTDTSGEVSFAADVAVTSPDTRLRIGLNVRMELIVAQEPDVLAAPYDVIYRDQNGVDCILVAEEQPDGTWLLREVAVELGLETDLDIAVKADGLTENTRVVSDPEKYVQYIGQPVIIGSGKKTTAQELRQQVMGGS